MRKREKLHMYDYLLAKTAPAQWGNAHYRLALQTPGKKEE